MKIIKVPYIEGTPARTNRKTGNIYVSMWHFNQLDEIYQKFIVYHEMAHFLFQTKDEEFCDEFAMNKMLREGYKLKDILHSVTRTLSNTKAHYGRKYNILQHLRIYDYLENNNTNVFKPI